MRYQKFDQYRDQIVNPQTGEVLERRSEHQTTYSRPISEEAFIKVYYNTYLATLGAVDSPLSTLLIAIGKRMTYSTTGQVVYLTKDARADIAAELGGRSDSYIKHSIKDLCDLGVLARVGGPRSATYQVSPFVLAKGDWTDVQALQLSYDAKLHKMGVEAPRPKYIEKAHKQGYQLVADEGTPTLPEPEVASYTRPDPEKIALQAEVAALKAQNAELKKAAESGQIPGQTSMFDTPQKPAKD